MNKKNIKELASTITNALLPYLKEQEETAEKQDKELYLEYFKFNKDSLGIKSNEWVSEITFYTALHQMVKIEIRDGRNERYMTFDKNNFSITVRNYFEELEKKVDEFSNKINYMYELTNLVFDNSAININARISLSQSLRVYLEQAQNTKINHKNINDNRLMLDKLIDEIIIVAESNNIKYPLYEEEIYIIPTLEELHLKIDNNEITSKDYKYVVSSIEELEEKAKKYGKFKNANLDTKFRIAYNENKISDFKSIILGINFKLTNKGDSSSDIFDNRNHFKASSICAKIIRGENIKEEEIDFVISYDPNYDYHFDKKTKQQFLADAMYNKDDMDLFVCANAYLLKSDLSQRNKNCAESYGKYYRMLQAYYRAILGSYDETVAYSKDEIKRIYEEYDNVITNNINIEQGCRGLMNYDNYKLIRYIKKISDYQLVSKEYCQLIDYDTESLNSIYESYDNLLHLDYSFQYMYDNLNTYQETLKTAKNLYDNSKKIPNNFNKEFSIKIEDILTRVKEIIPREIGNDIFKDDTEIKRSDNLNNIKKL